MGRLVMPPRPDRPPPPPPITPKGDVERVVERLLWVGIVLAIAIAVVLRIAGCIPLTFSGGGW